MKCSACGAPPPRAHDRLGGRADDFRELRVRRLRRHWDVHQRVRRSGRRDHPEPVPLLHPPLDLLDPLLLLLFPSSAAAEVETGRLNA